ncbi:replication initiation protein [Tortoise microvirus 63]|nr:replication initiation protein [Tortoise microvirus 63]
MSCANPITITVKGRPVQVGCRHCLSCRLDYQIALEFAVKHELFDIYQSGLGACFATLTYADSALPPHGSLRKSDFQNFLKNVRIQAKRKGTLPPFKYLACGEYGDKFGRPHYHVIFLGVTDALFNQFIRPLWKHGLCDCSTLGSGAIRYVLKYCTKSAMGSKAKEMYDDQSLTRPFIVHSKRLGFNWLIRNRDDLVANNFCYLNKGHRVPLPAYYRRQFDIYGTFCPLPQIQQLDAEAKQHGYPSYREWSIQKAFNREQDLTIAVRNDGIPVDSLITPNRGYSPLDTSIVPQVLNRS